MASTTSKAAQRELSYDEWLALNPIRAWRLGNKPKKISLLNAAGAIGVGTSMMQMYERGVHKPGPDRDEVLTRLLGADWSAKWDEWKNLPHSPV